MLQKFYNRIKHELILIQPNFHGSVVKLNQNENHILKLIERHYHEKIL